MPLSSNRDRRFPAEDEAISTIHAALDAGVTFIDTADCYAPTWAQTGHNELIVGKAVRSWGGDRDSIVIATKGGVTRSQGEVWGRNGSLDYLRSAAGKSLRNLGVEAIDLYQYHRPDAGRPTAKSWKHFRTLQQEGKWPWSPLGGTGGCALLVLSLPDNASSQ
jgi:aryl-alcohol dehydrogenase-like predicted oxidoreductase